MTYANGCTIVEVEVDPETAEVKILRIVFVHDAGKIINPSMVDGQLMGALAHGVGNGLYEWMGFGGDGQPLTTNLADYLLVTSTEMPPMEIAHKESPTPLNPLGVKGVGESGVIPLPAAIASAVEDALSPFNVRIRQIPIRPGALFAQLNGRASS
jgi:carbon-monoxide dehydrogenase large subunit